jgi:non-specific serine/threonine protein kinase
VCSDALLPAGSVAEVLHRLVAASLVILEHHTGGVRYRLIEIVREYALELLAGADEAASFRQRHADHVLELAELAPRDAIIAAHAAVLEGQQEELRAALAWALEMGEAELGLRMVAGAYPLWYARGHYAEGRSWIERLLALPAAASAPTRAFVERCMGRLLMNQGDYADAETWFRTSLERHARIDDRLGVALCERHLGTLAMWRGELHEAAEQLAEAARILHALGHPGQFAALFNGALVALELGNPGRALEMAAEIEVRGRTWQPTVASAWVLLLRALVVARNGNAQQAEELLTQALEIKQPLAYQQLRLILLTDLAHVLLDQGKMAQAQSALGESVHGAYDAGERMRFIRGIEGIARSAASNQLQAAVRLAGAAAGMRAAMGALPWPRDNWRSESWLPGARQKLGERAYKSAWIDGQVLTEGEALALARSMLDNPTEAGDQPVSPLTARETEVAALLARGLSTTDIAADLVISVATVRVHVEHILAKLDLHSRTQVAVWARESGLLAGQRV